MRNTIAALVLAPSILLGGCGTTGGPGSFDSIGAFIQAAQQAAVQACGFLPTAATITAIVTAGQFTTYFEIAAQICAVVTAPSPAADPQTRTAARRVAPKVSGVTVRGRFVR
jgi:hypothetical protein